MEEPVGALVGSIAEALGVTEFTLGLSFCWIGAILLGVGFHLRSRSYAPYCSAIGWSLLGLFFYLQSSHFVEISDPLLVAMTAGALPAGMALGVWEVRNWERAPESLVWLRGAVVWSVIPYYTVYSIPVLNMAFVSFTAHSTEWLLEFAGLGSYEVGLMRVDLPEGEVLASQWEGSKWLLTEPLGENGFFVPLNHSDGTPVSVSFILACSGLQSMIIFVGAIFALGSVPWKRRVRALLIVLPTIHVLNVFRNAGIVWLSDTYVEWSLFGIGMFDFTHSYAAKFASLFAMFLMAIALFDLLPELHKHILRILKPIMDLTDGEETGSSS